MNKNLESMTLSTRVLSINNMFSLSYFLYIFYKGTYILGKMRTWFWKLFLKSIGEDVVIERGCKFSHPYNITIGNNVYVNFGVKFLNTRYAEIIIGNDIIIGPNAVFMTTKIDYSNKNLPIKQGSKIHLPITVNDDVWIGVNAIIMPGITIGQKAIVGAGAVVTKDIPPYSVAVGVPAKVIKKYNFETNIWEKMK